MYALFRSRAPGTSPSAISKINRSVYRNVRGLSHFIVRYRKSYVTVRFQHSSRLLHCQQHNLLALVENLWKNAHISQYRRIRQKILNPDTEGDDFQNLISSSLCTDHWDDTAHFQATAEVLSVPHLICWLTVYRIERVRDSGARYKLQTYLLTYICGKIFKQICSVFLT